MTNNNNNIVISLSNEGSKCLTYGEYEKSIQHLATAFEQSRQDILNAASKTGNNDLWAEPRSLSSLSSSTAPAGKRKEPTKTCWIIDHWMKSPDLNPNDVTDLDNTSMMYIYSDPILIPSNSIPDVAMDPLLVNVIVSFDLGLAFLQSARYGNNNTSEETKNHQLRQALRLFQYSFRLQRSRGKTPQSPLFFMATVNNIGVLYANLGEIHHAQECFQQLLALLMYMNTNHHHAVGSSDASSSSNYGVFVQNTTVMSATSTMTNNNSNNSAHMSACFGAAGAA